MSSGPPPSPPAAGRGPVVGVVGGGQLARMLQQASIGLGITVRLLSETATSSAAQVVHDVVVGDHVDLDTLRSFARGCDVVTFDHEHVPTDHLRALEAEGIAVRPGPDALEHAQDKLVMRRRLSATGVPCPRWAEVRTRADVDAFGDAVGWPVVLKTPRGGYDGKGVRVVSTGSEAEEWLDRLGPATTLLAEERVPFTRELAALVARSPSGQAVAYPVVQTVQVDGVCREVVAPAPGLADDHAVAAQEAALRVAGALGVVGLLAVELFDTPAGVLVNELAMRPHNSGHWTIDGAVTSQFEQHLRAVLDLPLGSPAARAPYSVMVNVLGGELPDLYPAFLHCLARDPSLRVHVYGKTVVPGRKVGHVTVCGDDLDALLDRGRHAAAYLRGDIDE
ncbi:MAG TPA: 5-(carboxyamino)imidazole ribonucleotide synthase [Candidatus Limnocylindria bacterium]|nr:5-(carboxyamino)imidazole ribonucleotide synthase [Candidatus Limnocylindria bacterium]